MASHDEILAAVVRIAGARGDWSFAPNEIVRALPHLNTGTVRTHITSRCCINAPKNHPHKWDYFKRLGRGRYQLVTKYRPTPDPRAGAVREQPAKYGATAVPDSGRPAIHAVLIRTAGWYAAECLELAVVTQGRTMDETVANLRDAIALHLENADPGAFGLADHLALHISFEEPLTHK